MGSIVEKGMDVTGERERNREIDRTAGVCPEDRRIKGI